MIPPQLLAAIGVVILLTVTHGYAYMTGSKHKENEYKAALVAALEKVRETEKTWQGAADAIVKNLESKRAVTQRNLDTALNGLRDRPERHLSNDTGTVCKGASGAELSRPDAVFLVREAARGDRLQAALDACYTYADTLRKPK